MNNTPQKSRYAFPVAVAVATHAFLFFGFTPSKPPPVEKAPPIKPTDVDWTVKLDPPPPEDPPEVGYETPLRRTEFAPPTGRETITNDPGPFRIEPTFEPPRRGIEGAVLPTGPTNLIGDSFRPGTISAAHLDKPPHATFQAKPDYPYSLRHDGFSGEVLVEFVVDEKGYVINARVIRASHPDFEAATLRAISKWRFEPGKRNGKVVRFRMTQPITFSVGAAE